MDSEMDNEKDDADQTENRLPRMSEWSSMMDEIIGEAIGEGLFDDLPGQGKPLKLNDNPFGSDSELAFELLKHNEYTLPWIAERTVLLNEIEALREEISQKWNEYSDDNRATSSEPAKRTLYHDWDKQLKVWGIKIQELNKGISKTNLKQPGDKLEILKLTLETELNRVGAENGLS